MEVRAADLARDQRLELSAQLAADLVGPVLGGAVRRLAGLVLAHPHVVPARHEPRAEQRREQAAEQRGRERHARYAAPG